ncbi:MAG: magnesium transporter [Chlamydiae bacterium]|nr:magnesium transporter [Chlamydiota bacterium]
MPFQHLDRKVKTCMTQVKTVVFEDQTIEEALKVLRDKHISEKVIYFYVVDRNQQLKGLVTTRDLLLKDQETVIGSIVQPNVIVLNQDQTVKEAMELMEVQRLLALPVVDDKNRLLGAIDVGVYLEEAVDVANTKKRVQIFQLLGIILEEGKHFSVMRSYRTRMPWIFCNMIGGVACAIISHMYADVMAKALILAMFIPLVLSLSESISMQSMTQSLSMVHSRLNIWQVIKQSKLYVLLAVTCSLIIGSIALMWEDGIKPAFVIGIGILISIVITATIGGIVPFILHRGKLDPKVAAGPVVLMIADIVTTLIYFSIASAVLF